MLEIKPIDLKSLPKNEIQAYVIPEVLDQLDNPSNSVAIEARLDQKRIGLAVAIKHPDTHHAELISIMVDEPYRRQGIGKALFGRLQNLLAEENLGFMRFVYDKSTPSGEALTKIITAYGWALPTLHVIRLHFDVFAFDVDWLHHLAPLPPEIKIFPWKKRSVNDVFWIDYFVEQGRVLPSVSPANYADKIDYPTSVGMRRNETLIGWCVTQRMKPDTIRYSSLFIDHFYTHTPYGIRLLAESIRRQKEIAVQWAYFEINLQEIDRTWGLFVKKRLMPQAYKMEKIYLAMAELKRNSEFEIRNSEK